jgi:hypothetical protein
MIALSRSVMPLPMEEMYQLTRAGKGHSCEDMCVAWCHFSQYIALR